MSNKSISDFFIPDVAPSAGDSKLSVLFILKKQHAYWQNDTQYPTNQSGLTNSALFVSNMLQDTGLVASSMAQVVDGNAIDKVVTERNPDVIVLEAIWVTPEKLRELAELPRNANRIWVVRNHSELPFLAMEGISLKWLLEYAQIKNVHVASNSPIAAHDLDFLIAAANIPYGNVLLLPNYYPITTSPAHRELVGDHLDVGCFGAIRPLKNQAEQALGAMLLSFRIGKKLRFHINATRQEGAGSVQILKTLRAMFDAVPSARLIEHGWLDRQQFLALCAKLDVGSQVSFSETFNIVSADLVSQGTPIATSNEIPWVNRKYYANPCSAVDIADKLELALDEGVRGQHRDLVKYVGRAKLIWLHQLRTLGREIEELQE